MADCDVASLSNPRLLSVGTASPATSYTQPEVLDFFGSDDRRMARIFSNSAIDRRSLVLPERGPDGRPADESQAQLLEKHLKVGLEIGERALRLCLEKIAADPRDIRHLCCVTTTGFLTPGFSALLVNRMGLRDNVARLDVVGMGCNAGLNGLSAVAAWSRANPGQLAVMICIEVCSAAYVVDNQTETAVVNSLFGDGAAAVAVLAGKEADASGPALRKFSSRLIPDSLGAMRFDWDGAFGKFRFRLQSDVPYAVGSNAPDAIEELLCDTGLRRRDVSHWVIHSGGKKVIDSMKANLQLTAFDLRHTTSVLRDHGNLSSGSFLFSYSRLLEEGRVQPGDLGVLIAMGPGASIESALIQW